MVFPVPAFIMSTFIPAAHSFRPQNFMLMPADIVHLLIFRRPWVHPGDRVAIIQNITYLSLKNVAQKIFLQNCTN